jgi:uncharacterized membrane protein (UPF0136 family)
MRKLNVFLAALCFCALVNKANGQFSGGTGVSGDPYIITTAAQLKTLADSVNAGITKYVAAYYQLDNDIDLSAYQSGEGWIPIGSGSVFKGSFDGNGKKITGLKINPISPGNIGLFGYVNNGKIENIGLEAVNIDVNISISQTMMVVRAGGVAGYIQNSILSNCYSTGAINISFSCNRGLAYAGGLVGYLDNNSNLSNCYSTGTINASVSASQSNAYAGGIVGCMSNNNSLSNCYATGTVNASSASTVACTGGIAGYISANDSLSNCAALNPDLSCSGPVSTFGRITGGGTILTNNIAFDKMINPADDTTWNNKGATQSDGEDISKNDINADSTLGGRFTVANGWSTQNGKLPGLFGNTVNMPGHLCIESPQITTESLSNGTVGTAYNQILIASGHTPITWLLEGGNLPNGLNLSPTGIISGTPTAEGRFNFRVKATNACGNDSKPLYIVIGADGIVETGYAPSLRVYPNPTTGELRIKNEELREDAVIEIYNVMGQTLIAPFNSPEGGKLPSFGEAGGCEIVIDISHLAAGMYFLKCTDAINRVCTVRFVKE